jgi:thiamine pyrophosphokinase
VVFEVSLDYIWHMDEFGDAHFSILLGGTLTPTPRLLCQIAGSRVIAADGGILHAETLAVLSINQVVVFGDWRVK